MKRSNDVNFTLRLSDEEMWIIEDYAGTNGMTKSGLIRLALKEFFYTKRNIFSRLIDRRRNNETKKL